MKWPLVSRSKYEKAIADRDRARKNVTHWIRKWQQQCNRAGALEVELNKIKK